MTALQQSVKKPRSRLWWIGPGIIAIGAAGAIVAAWYFERVQPRPGAVIDTIPIAQNADLVVRAEQGGPRSFLELDVDGKVRWQAYIPHYAGAKGRPGIAWSRDVATVRTDGDDGSALVYAFSLDTAAKIAGFRLAVEHDPVKTQPTGPVTLTDHLRSYEFVGGSGWHQLIAVSLGTGDGLWKVDLGPAPVTDGGVGGGVVWVQQGSTRREFDAVTGSPHQSNNP